MFKILFIFFLTSILTKKLDGQATGLANVSLSLGGVAPSLPMITATNPESSKLEHEQEHEHNNISEHEHEGNSEHEETETNNNEETETTEQTTTEASGNEERSCHRDNEIFDRCGGCEGTCTNPNPVCTALCNFNNAGCRCRDGFVRDRNGRCIRSSSCPDNNPPSCGRNEDWDECGGCEKTCSKPNPVCTALCNFNNAGCRCRDGFVRDRNGLCIRPSSCPNNNPPSCGRNEDWNECGGCEATCNNPNPSCPFICGPGACRCRDGWVRHPNGNCVDRQQCFSNQCRLNEVFNRCSTGCEGTCSNTRPSCISDSQSCRFSRCECPVSSGFVRDNFGNCIPSSQCPSQNPPSCCCLVGHVCVMRKPSNCNFCSEQPTCIKIPSCQNMICPNGFSCAIPSCQSFPCDPICVRS